MRQTSWLVLAVALTACAKPHNNGTYGLTQALDVDEQMQPARYAPAVASPEANARPQIAYTYALTYRLDNGTIAGVQAKQVALCASLGEQRCRLESTSLAANDDPAGGASGSTKFLIDARLARSFIVRLDTSAQGEGGTISNRQTDAEDVTKQIIDTDARVRGKQALADRLVKLIQTSNGNVGELVQAEKAYADTQSELDAARQMQATLRQRVAMSEVTVDYASISATRTWGPATRSLAGVGSTLATSVAALVTFTVAASPWLLLLTILVWIGRRRGLRLRWWRRPMPPRA